MFDRLTLRYLGGFRIERDIELVASEPCSPLSGMQPTVEIQGTSDDEWCAAARTGRKQLSSRWFGRVLCCEADVTVRGVQLVRFDTLLTAVALYCVLHCDGNRNTAATPCNGYERSIRQHDIHEECAADKFLAQGMRRCGPRQVRKYAQS